jgi:hypothetical protein
MPMNSKPQLTANTLDFPTYRVICFLTMRHRTRDHSAFGTRAHEHWRGTRTRDYSTGVVLFWSLLIFWAAATTLWAIKPEESLQRIPTAVSLWLLYVAAVSVRITRKEFSWITLMVVIGGCTASLCSTYQ